MPPFKACSSFLTRYNYGARNYDFPYKISQLLEENIIHPPGVSPSFYLKFNFRYIVIITPTRPKSIPCQRILGTMCIGMYVSQKDAFFDFWVIFVRKYFRRFGVPDDIAIRLIGDVFEFAKTMEVDPTNTGKRVLPVLVDMDCRTIQRKDEIYRDVMRRVLRKYTYMYLPVGQVEVKYVEKLLSEDMINLWIKKNEDYVKDCAICQGDGDDGYVENGIRLSCSHVYHQSCIFRWIMKNHTCPLCRSHVFSRAIRILSM